MTNGLVQLIIGDEYFCKKLLKEVTNASTNEVYEKVLEKFLIKFPTSGMDVEKLRNKFKTCVRLVNKVIMPRPVSILTVCLHINC